MDPYGGIAVFVLAGAVAALLFLGPVLARRRPAELTRRQQAVLADAVPLHACLTPAQRRRFDEHVARFLADKRFFGCGGLELTEDMCLAIAGQACQICLHRTDACFSSVHEILVYPSAFWVRHETPDELGLVDDDPQLLAGEAWEAGRVILSWEDVAAALEGSDHNVVVHEFAHQLDYDAPGTVGAPALADHRSWAAAFSAAYDQLRDSGSPVIDPYGAENPAEFFAVVVEAFIQRPGELADAHPELYRVLADYLTVGPAQAPGRPEDALRRQPVSNPPRH